MTDPEELQIVRYPHPALRYKSRDVTRIDNNLRATVRKMFELMYEANGIGLAANQVALPFRLFVVNLTADPAETSEEFVFINPVISSSKGAVTGEEGCLSLPELYAQVRRADQITVQAFDLAGDEFEMTLDEMAARAVQHEHDHLNGVLFTDHLSEKQKLEVAPVLETFESDFRQLQASGSVPDDEQLVRRLEELSA